MSRPPTAPFAAAMAPLFPCVELLEMRIAPAAFIWDGSRSSDWFDPVNWNPDGVPGPADSATLDIATTINLSLAVSVGIFRQSAGTLTSVPGATLTVLQSLDWSGGTMSGAGATVLPAGSLSVLTGPAIKRSIDRAIDIAGVVTWSGNGALALDEATLTIQAGGLLDIQTDAAIGDSDGTGSSGRPPGTLIIDGTLRKSASSGTTDIGGTLPPSGDGRVNTTVNAGGKIEVRSGILHFIGGSMTMSGSFDVSPPGIAAVDVTATVNNGAAFLGSGAVRLLNGANFSGGTVTSTSLELAGGTFAGGAIISGDWLWTSGRTTGNFTHAAGGLLSLSGSAPRAIETGTFRLAGTAIWTGTGTFAIDDGTLAIPSGGLLDIQNDSTIGDSNGTGSSGRPAGRLIIDGVVRKSAGSGTTTIGGTLPPSGDGRVNTTVGGGGSIEVQSGTLNFLGGSLATSGSIKVAPGGTLLIDVPPDLGNATDFTGPGVTQLRAGATLTGGTVKASNLELAGGNLSGSGIILGDWSWSGGTSTADITHAAGGVLTLSGANRKTINVGSFHIAGSAIWKGSGDLALDDATLTIESGGLFDIQTDAVLGDSNGTGSTGRPPGTLIVDGTLRKSASAGTTTIGGTLAPSGDGRVNTGVGSTGRVEVQSGTLSFVTGAFDNSGVVDAGAHNLSIGGGVSSGTFVVSPGGSIRFTGGRQSLANGASLSGGGQYEIAGGQLDADAAVSATNLAFSSGFLGGSGELTIMQNFAWSGGTMVGSSGTTTLAAGSISIFSGAALKRSSDRAIQLAGAATWTGSGDLALDDATFTIAASGLLDIQTDASVGDSNGTGSTGRPAGTLIVDGTLRKSASSGTSTIGGTLAPSGDGLVDTTVHGSGRIEVQTGSLTFIGRALTTSGAFDVAANSTLSVNVTASVGDGAVFSGSGAVRMLGGANFTNANVTSTGLEFAGGDFTGAAIISGDWSWTAGRTSGSFTHAAGGVLALSGNGSRAMNSGSFNIAGTAIWSGTGALAVDDATLTIESSGLLDIQNDSTLGDSNGTGSTGRPAGTLIIDGILRKSAGLGTTTIGDTLPPSGDGRVNTTLNSSGRIEVQTGTVNFVRGSLSIAAPIAVASGSSMVIDVAPALGEGTDFTGPGATQLRAGANLTGTSVRVSNLELAGGNLSGSGIILGDWSWSGGTSTADVTHAVGGVLTLSGANRKTINTGSFHIAGSAIWKGSGELALDDATLTIESTGLLDIQNDSTLGDSNGTGSAGRPPGTLIIDGILRKSAGFGTTTMGGTLPPSGDGRVNTVLNGSGRIEVQTGTLNFVSGDLGIAAPIAVATGSSVVIDVAPALGEGADFTGPGATQLRAGASLIGGTVRVSKLELAGGNLGGAGIISGDWSWSGGSSTADITHAAGGVLTFSGANRKTINVGSFHIGGSAIWSGSGELALDDATLTIESGGLFDIQTDAVLGDSNGTASSGRPPGSLIVEGTLRKSAGAGITTIGGTLAPSGDGRIDIAVHLGGSIEAESGVLRFLGGTFVNGGTVDAKSGSFEFANFTQIAGVTNLGQSDIGGGASFRFEGGELRGKGTITGDIVNVGATVQPGGRKGAGTLMVAGNYEQQSGGKLAIELGGSNAGIDSDQLLVSNVATFDGALEVNSIGGFIIPDGGTFSVMSYASSNGSFASLDAPAGLTVDQRGTELVLNASAPPAGPRSVTLTDIDGDVVTVKVNKGSLPANAIRLGPNGELQRIDLRTIGSTLAGAKLTIEAQQAGGGDGAVNVGAIDATGMDFAKVSVDGDLGQIDIGTGAGRKPALKSLAVGSLGAMGASTQASGTDDPLLSEIQGSLGKLSVAVDVKNAVVSVGGKLGKVLIGGNLVDSAAPTVRLGGAGRIGVFLNGGIPPANASHAGAIFAPDIGSVTVMGDIDGGEIGAENQIKKVKVVGKLMSDDPLDPAILRVGENIERAIISGDVQNALILAGYNRALEPRNPDASIGTITVKGNWNASSVVAGVADPGDNGFGINDTIIPGDDTPGVFSRIAKVIIKGSASGSATVSDRSAITAQKLGALSVGGEKISLTGGRDDVVLDPGRQNFRAVEI